MKAAVLYEKTKVEIRDIERPECGVDEILVKVTAVGVCGSDIHYYKHGNIGERIVQYPHIQGHEAVGEVVAIGENIKKVGKGDRVLIEPGIACGICTYCVKGSYHLCDSMHFLSTPPNPGLFVEFAVLPEKAIHKITSDVSDEIATLAEPLSVGIHAIRRGNLLPSEDVYISGMGPVGLLSIIAAESVSPRHIDVGDFNTHRLEAAKKLGATHTYNLNIEKVDKQYDVVIETSGAPQALQQAINLVKPGGKIVVVGFPPDDVTLNVVKMIQKEIDLITVYRYVHTYPLAIQLIETYNDKLMNVITHTYTLEEIEMAMDTAANPNKNAIKVVVKPH